eukprot:7993503-Pyramimonas_sp.AAC.1
MEMALRERRRLSRRAMQDRAEKTTTRATPPTLRSYLRAKMIVAEDREDRLQGVQGGQTPLMAG